LKDIRLILTIRSDLVAQYASLELAQQTGKYHSWVKSKRSFSGKIKINRNEFIKYVYDYLKIISLLKDLEKSHNILIFNYEDNILNGDLNNFYSLFDFLDLPRIEMNWLNSKKVSPPPEEYIENHNNFYSLMEKIMSLEQEGCSRQGVYEKLKEKSVLLYLRNISRKTLKKIGA